jgi:hypothetical protein
VELFSVPRIRKLFMNDLLNDLTDRIPSRRRQPSAVETVVEVPSAVSRRPTAFLIG